MDPFRQLLQNDFVVTAKVAGLLYSDDSAAAKVRLRDRAAGKLRFTREEYKKLLKLFRDMTVRLRTKADRLEAAAATPKADLRKVLDHPTLNLKAVILAALPDRPYSQVYDRLRDRGALTEGEVGAIAAALRAFAATVEEAVAAAKEAAKDYEFSRERPLQKNA